MADSALNVQFVWLDADWPEVEPMNAKEAIDRAAFWVDGADSRQPALSIAHRVVPAGSVVEQALALHLNARARERLAAGEVSAAVFGRRARAIQPLYDGDRIELLGPISADPKSRRRARVQQERQLGGRDKWKTIP